MPRLVQAALRVVMAIFVIVLCSRPGPAEAAPATPGLTPAEAFAFMVADQNGECSAEDHANPLEPCGVELFGDLVADHLLLLSRDTCSVLLEELFKDQICAPGDPDCDAASNGALPAPAGKVVSSGGSSVSGDLDAQDARILAALQAARWRRAASEAVPQSLSLAPPVPPPERAV